MTHVRLAEMRNVRRALLAIAALATAACELDRASVPRGDTQLVVHAVLNPNSDFYTVLVEESLSGRLTVDTTQATDPSEPILSSGGVPVSDAVVRITRISTGEVARGHEDARYAVGGRGHGVYRFRNALKAAFDPVGTEHYIPILRGTAYSIRVEKNGRVVTGRTTVPEPGPGVGQVQGRPRFNRDHDSLVINFPSVVSGARGLLRIATPYGPFTLFSDSGRFVVPGTLRNAFADGLPSAFVPGFESNVLLAVVDSNYFDYYRSFNSPFTGSGLISHLSGGSGLFGSFLPLDTRRLDITADYTHPLDGRYVGGASGRDTLELWVDDEVRGGQLVSGSLRLVQANGFQLGRAPVLGVLADGTLALRVLGSGEVEGYSGTATVTGTVLSFVTPQGTRRYTRVPR
jgi:hypothetical protein